MSIGKKRMVRTLLIDACVVFCEEMTRMLSSYKGVELAGYVKNDEAPATLVEDEKPGAIVMQVKVRYVFEPVYPLSHGRTIPRR